MTKQRVLTFSVFIMLIGVLGIGCGIFKSPRDDEKADHDSVVEKYTPSNPDAPCCEVSLKQIENLEIYVNGIPTGKIVPAHVDLEIGDVVNLSSTVKPGTQGFLVTQGEVSQNGAWVVRGNEKFIRFSREESDVGQDKLVNTGQEEWMVGYDLNRPIGPEKFAALFNEQKAPVLYADQRKGLPWDLLRGWSDLLVLDISETDVEAIDFLKDQVNIRALYLSGNPVSDLDVLKAMPELRILEIDRCSVESIKPLADLIQMRQLSLRTTKVRSLRPLRRLSNLQVLDAADTDVTDLAPLANLHSLRRLSLAGTLPRNLSALKQHPALEQLNLNDTPISDLRVLGKMLSLKTLSVKRTKIKSLDFLKNMPALEEIYLDGTNVRNISQLANAPGLRKVGLVGVRATDASVLFSLDKLGWVSFSKSAVPYEQKRRLKNEKAFCKIIGLGKPD